MCRLNLLRRYCLAAPAQVWRDQTRDGCACVGQRKLCCDLLRRLSTQRLYRSASGLLLAMHALSIPAGASPTGLFLRLMDVLKANQKDAAVCVEIADSLRLICARENRPGLFALRAGLDSDARAAQLRLCRSCAASRRSTLTCCAPWQLISRAIRRRRSASVVASSASFSSSLDLRVRLS